MPLSAHNNKYIVLIHGKYFLILMLKLLQLWAACPMVRFLKVKACQDVGGLTCPAPVPGETTHFSKISDS